MNPATVWAETAVSALAGAGLRAVCVTPGSRSTALALAFAAHPDVYVYGHLDERSAGFFALGMALTLDRPVALLCTSGTAAANFMPAIVEARMAQVPLLALTADRPPELRYSGANQTIDQIRMYGEQVLWSVDAPLPERAPPAVALRNLRALMARAMARANGIRKGPVHLNFPFRKPFEPPEDLEVDEGMDALRAPRIVTGVIAPPEDVVEQLEALLVESERGFIVCGPRSPAGEFPQAIAALSQRSGYPILADPLSGLRYGPWVADAVVCGAYETILARNGDVWSRADVVLRFGAAPTSKWLNEFLGDEARKNVVHVRQNGVWADESHRTALFVQAHEALLCRALCERLPERPASSWQRAIRQAEQTAWRAMSNRSENAFFDGLVLDDVVGLLPEDALLFAGNSLPVRHLDQFGAPRAKGLRVFANRGASGIDGNISTALGIAAAEGKPVTLVVGDVTFYHDMNGLLAAGRHDLDATVVLLNNGGGGIFRRLPVATVDPPFTDLFLTPHGLDFAHAARLYGFEHVRVDAREAFRRAFAGAVGKPARRIIEVCTDSAQDLAHRKGFMDDAAIALQGM